MKRIIGAVVLMTVMSSMAYAQSITTLFASNNSGGTTGMVFFDAVVGGFDLEVTGMDWNLNDDPGTAFGVSIYTRPGTAEGFETSNAGWTFQTGGSGTTAGLDLHSVVNMDNSFTLDASTTTGMMIHVSGVGFAYTNGDGTSTYGSGTNQTYTNADLSVLAGAATNTPWAGPVFSPRVVNMQMYYDSAVPEPGSMIALGLGASALLARRRRRKSVA